jgi:hypothetical protein
LGATSAPDERQEQIVRLRARQRPTLDDDRDAA